MSQLIQYVLFDLGDTLVYFDGDMPAVLQECNRQLVHFLQKIYPSLEAAAFLQAFEDRMNAYYRQRENEFVEQTTAYVLKTLLAEQGHFTPPQTLIEQALQAMYQASQAHWWPEDDAAETLTILQAQGYRLGLVSNSAYEGNVYDLVHKAQLGAFFDVVISSSILGIRKPNPLIFLAALAHWGAEPGQAVMIGDTLGADVLGARNAGMRSIWITRRANTSRNRDHLDTIRPDAQIATLAELPAALNQLAGLQA